MANVAVMSDRVARRPKKIRSEELVRLSSMISGLLVKKVDQLAEKLTAEDPYGKVYTRTDALKRVIVDGLKANGIE